jgi:pimeloyl-ACP methyl ester carboxylesterase
MADLSTSEDNISDPKESLLTPRAFQLSMTAPRCPPYYTAQRSLLVGRHPRPETHLYLTPDVMRSISCSAGGVETAQHEKLMDRFIYQAKTRNNRDCRMVTKSSLNRSPQRRVSAVPPASMISYRYPNASRTRLSRLTHPQLGSLGPDFSSQLTRLLGTILPLKWQNRCRDSGGFRSIADTLVLGSIPMAALSHPVATIQFLKLTKARRRLVYGNSKHNSNNTNYNAQFVDVFLPDSDLSSKLRRHKVRGMVFFVHGGAWGSGKPWFYRLVARPFLQLGLAVAVVGYRVYPLSKSVQDQVEDLESAYTMLVEEYPEWCLCCGKDQWDDCDTHLGTIVIGHSSGAHIALLWMVDRVKMNVLQNTSLQREKLVEEATPAITMFIGISGPYNIDHHFDYEAARGVEEISPLKAANGFSRAAFLQNSPVWRLQDAMVDFSESDTDGASFIEKHFPQRTLLIHGIEDDTVPFTATGEAARVLRACDVHNCQEEYVPETGHQDAVLHLMMGGRVQKAIVKWLLAGVQESNKSEITTCFQRSKL